LISLQPSHDRLTFDRRHDNEGRIYGRGRAQLTTFDDMTSDDIRRQPYRDDRTRRHFPPRHRHHQQFDFSHHPAKHGPSTRKPFDISVFTRRKTIASNATITKHQHLHHRRQHHGPKQPTPSQPQPQARHTCTLRHHLPIPPHLGLSSGSQPTSSNTTNQSQPPQSPKKAASQLSPPNPRCGNPRIVPQPPSPSAKQSPKPRRL